MKTWVLLLFISLMLASSRCAESQATPPRCCDAGLLNPNKLLPGNLPAADPVHKTLVLLAERNSSIDFTALLADGVGKDSVTWMADGKSMPAPVLRLSSVPEPDHVRILTVAARARSGTGIDSFQLVVVPAQTRKRFDDWLAGESADKTWLKSVPPVYSTLGPKFSDPEPSGCDRWGSVNRIESQFHPGGAYEMRSRVFGDGHGHQAVYDSSGKLMRIAPGAGSADRATPRWISFGYLKHVDRDVKPFVWAAQLDGNPVNPKILFLNLDRPLIRMGTHLEQYMSVRPILSEGPEQVIAAGSCGSPPQR